jgi:ABC-type antimicrobial peptide transport system permease subunit
MLLGAESRVVLKTVLSEAVSIVAIGILVGIGTVFAATRLIETLLFDVAPQDPLSITAAALLMLTVSLIAAYWPARRASRVDPMIAIRHE